jgi:hypothetical protein
MFAAFSLLLIWGTNNAKKKRVIPDQEPLNQYQMEDQMDSAQQPGFFPANERLYKISNHIRRHKRKCNREAIPGKEHQVLEMALRKQQMVHLELIPP